MSAPTVHRTASVDVSCDACGRLVHLMAQAVRWQRHRGQWEVAEWGPATGECCGTALVVPCFAVGALPPTPRLVPLPEYAGDGEEVTRVVCA